MALYDTAAATGLESNNTVTRPLEHMITESDVPDYAELQRHHGHREKMYSVNALLNPMPCINFMQMRKRKENFFWLHCPLEEYFEKVSFLVKNGGK